MKGLKGIVVNQTQQSTTRGSLEGKYNLVWYLAICLSFPIKNMKIPRNKFFRKKMSQLMFNPWLILYFHT